MRLVARGASGRWSHGSARKISDGSSEVVRFNRLNLFLNKPSIFQVNIFRLKQDGFASDSWTDMSENFSLNARIFVEVMLGLGGESHILEDGEHQDQCWDKECQLKNPLKFLLDHHQKS